MHRHVKDGDPAALEGVERDQSCAMQKLHGFQDHITVIYLDQDVPILVFNFMRHEIERNDIVRGGFRAKSKFRPARKLRCFCTLHAAIKSQLLLEFGRHWCVNKTLSYEFGH